PPKINIEIHQRDYAEELGRALDSLAVSGNSIAPAFAFVDPYGFKLSMPLLNRFLKAGKTELLVNFMFRYVDMAMYKEDKKSILNELFGTREWRELRSVLNYSDRVKNTVKLFAS